LDQSQLGLKAWKKKNGELRNRLKEFAVAHDKQTDELLRENVKLQETITGLERTVLELNSIIKSRKRDLSLAKQQLKEAQAAASDTEASLSRDH
jgi:sugar-specific transcriptional regulator TrmB